MGWRTGDPIRDLKNVYTEHREFYHDALNKAGLYQLMMVLDAAFPPASKRFVVEVEADNKEDAIIKARLADVTVKEI